MTEDVLQRFAGRYRATIASSPATIRSVARWSSPSTNSSPNSPLAVSHSQRAAGALTEGGGGLLPQLAPRDGAVVQTLAVHSDLRALFQLAGSFVGLQRADEIVEVAGRGPPGAGTPCSPMR